MLHIGIYRSNGHELGQTKGDIEVQGGLVCCTPWGHKESDTTGRLETIATVDMYTLLLHPYLHMGTQVTSSSPHRLSYTEKIHIKKINNMK